MSAMCAYDRSKLHADVVTQMGCLHPISNSGRSFRWYAAEPPAPARSNALALALTGEVDRSTFDMFRAALGYTDIARGQSVVLDATGLAFIDHHALAALDDLGRRYDTRIAVLNAGRTVERIAEFMNFEHLMIGGPS